jgi:carboxypeptidase Taq
MRESPYRALETRFNRLGLVNEALAVLNWDTAAMMPEGGAAARAEQLAELKVIAHGMLTAPDLPDLLAGAESDLKSLDGWQRANLAEMRRLWLHATAVPADLVASYSKACSECEMVWRKARPASDFKSVLPFLWRVLDLTRAVAAAKVAKLGTTPYEALLDQFEPGGSVAEIDRLFDHLAQRLPGLIEGVLEAQARRKPPLVPRGPFQAEAQSRAARLLMEKLGFDFTHGRLDSSLHPFCGGTPDDVRITTRYDENDFARALMGVLHETGHALYERGLPSRWRRQPVGEARGMSVHESQSLLVEMQLCRSREFLEFAAPVLRQCFAVSGPEWEAGNLYRLGIGVARSLIRVDADEVTYPSHVILRYRLERALVADELDLADLPGAWNEGMERLVGVAPPDDRQGCLQDIHWYDGAWGYFPTYTLGAMTAAQLFDAAQRDPAVPAGISRGNFAPLLAWLRAHVHGLASSLPAREILVRATGKPLDPAVFERHLRQRYLAA